MGFCGAFSARSQPTLIGYYRLLLGSSQKSFYTGATELGMFKLMESASQIGERAQAALPALCKELNKSLAELLDQLSPKAVAADIEQLPLLTLGAQFDGSYRNSIGRAATSGVFIAIKEVLADHISSETASAISLVNSAGRAVRVKLATDPDVVVTEEVGNEEQMSVAMEIKGGADRSNAHNRAGEAEKSHRKVVKRAREHWTLIAMKGLNQRQLETESPTTSHWFDICQVLAREGGDWDRFVQLLTSATGVPTTVAHKRTSARTPTTRQ